MAPVGHNTLQVFSSQVGHFFVVLIVMNKPSIPIEPCGQADIHARQLIHLVFSIATIVTLIMDSIFLLLIFSSKRANN